MSIHWKAIFGVILIFILGFTSGLVCSSIYVHRKIAAFLKHPGAVAEAALEKRLMHNLALDQKQKQQIHDYFQENLQSRRELSQQIQPQVRMANLETYQKINSILRPDQQEIFHQNLEDFRKRAAKSLPREELENLPPTGAVPPTSDAVAPAGN